MWYVYGLRCKDGSLYLGSTNNLARRLEEHAQGKSRSTKFKLPMSLEFSIAVKAEVKARELEKYCKTGSGKAILKKRILTDEASA